MTKSKKDKSTETDAALIKQLQAELVKIKNEKEEILRYHSAITSRMKEAFRMGIAEIGEITITDVTYNLDLMERMMKNKFSKKKSHEC